MCRIWTTDHQIESLGWPVCRLTGFRQAVDCEVRNRAIRIDYDDNFGGIVGKMTNAAIQGEAFSPVDWVSANNDIRPEVSGDGGGPVGAIIGDDQQPIPLPKLTLYSGIVSGSTSSSLCAGMRTPTLPRIRSPGTCASAFSGSAIAAIVSNKKMATANAAIAVAARMMKYEALTITWNGSSKRNHRGAICRRELGSQAPIPNFLVEPRASYSFQVIDLAGKALTLLLQSLPKHGQSGEGRLVQWTQAGRRRDPGQPQLSQGKSRATDVGGLRLTTSGSQESPPSRVRRWPRFPTRRSHGFRQIAGLVRVFAHDHRGVIG